jgi:hypothetical protein
MVVGSRVEVMHRGFASMPCVTAMGRCRVARGARDGRSARAEASDASVRPPRREIFLGTRWRRAGATIDGVVDDAVSNSPHRH